MKYKNESDRILYVDMDIPCISAEDIRIIVDNSKHLPAHASSRLCLHPDTSSKLHEMYIIHEKYTYIRPHRHTDKDESCVVLEGQMALLIFSDNGDVTCAMMCGSYRSGETFHVRIPKNCWHCQIVLSEQVIFYEVTTGPFKKAAVEYAPFSPEIGSPMVQAYMDTLHSFLLSGRPNDAVLCPK